MSIHCQNEKVDEKADITSMIKYSSGKDSEDFNRVITMRMDRSCLQYFAEILNAPGT